MVTPSSSDRAPPEIGGPEPTEYFQTRTIAPDGSLSPVQDLTTASPYWRDLQVTVSDAGGE